MTKVRIEPWSDDDLEVLYRSNDPEMTDHLGGPETEDKVLDRHQRYLALRPPAGQMFVVYAMPDDRKAGSVGFWEREWLGRRVYEMGWGTFPEFQGRGVARAAATAALTAARSLGQLQFVHAYPGVDHPASNAVCAAAGFTLLGPYDFEYPPGNPMRCNDWIFDLNAPP